jgi:hypothetical protein
MLRRLGLFLTPEELEMPAELHPGHQTVHNPAGALPDAPTAPARLTPPELPDEMRPQWVETSLPWRQKRSWRASRSAT